MSFVREYFCHLHGSVEAKLLDDILIRYGCSICALHEKENSMKETARAQTEQNKSKFSRLREFPKDKEL